MTGAEAKSGGCLCAAYWSFLPWGLPNPYPLFLVLALSVLFPRIVAMPAFGGSTASDPRPTEYDVKAAYLLNFGKFMRIEGGETANPQGSFAVCVIGDDPIESSLKTLTAGERINGRLVTILHVKDGAAARACQIVYLSGSEGTHLDHDLEQLRGADTLTVSDASTFLARGGMIQFLLVSDHVRFSVGLDAVRQTHVGLSSELLRVAYSVSGKPAKEGS